MSYTWKHKPVVEFDFNICRLCAEISDSLFPIFDVDLTSKNRIDVKIKKCFPSLLIDERDLKPKQICMSCLSKLNVCDELFDLCFSAESKFNSILNEPSSLQGDKGTVVETCVIKQSSNCLWPADSSKSEKTVTVHDGGVIVLSKMGSDMLDAQHETSDNRDFVVMVELKYKESDTLTNDRNDIARSETDIDSYSIQDKLQSLVTFTEEACAFEPENLEKDKQCDNSSVESEMKDHNLISANQLMVLESSGTDSSKEKCLRLVTNNSVSMRKNVCEKVNDQVKKRINGKSSSGKKLFICSICCKHFQRRTRLNSHMAIHTEIRPHSCDQCNESFVMRWDLTLHQRIHSRTFECEHCSKIFTVRSKLDRHMRTHTGEKPHICGYCCTSFGDKRNLDNHLRTHTGEKPYVCNICNRSFRVRTHLTDHQRVHTKEMPFRCDACGKTFRWRANYNSHLKMHSCVK